MCHQRCSRGGIIDPNDAFEKSEWPPNTVFPSLRHSPLPLTTTQVLTTIQPNTDSQMASDTQSLPMLLTVRETAELLRTTDKAIYSMVERAQLPGVTRVGRRVLVRSADLLRWLDHNRAPSSCVPTKHSALPTQSPPSRHRK